MTLEEKSTAYAEKHWLYYAQSTLNEPWLEVKKLIKGIYLAGATEALASQWVSVEDELPKERRVVLCYMPDMKDEYAEDNSYCDIAVLIDGKFSNSDAEIIHPSHWMRIPPVKGGDL